MDAEGIAVLPLLTAGISDPVNDLLRQAGVPILRLKDAAPTGRHTQSFAGRIVLADSSNPVGRAEWQPMARHGLKLIDLAPLLTRSQSWLAAISRSTVDELLESPDAVSGTFFSLLKREVERQNGIWVRLADYPYPFQSMICRDSAEVQPAIRPLRDLFAVNEYSTIGKAATNRYWAGMPTFLNGMSPLNFPKRSVENDVDPSVEFPLSWRCTAAEFANWWQLRLQIRMQCSRAGSECELRIRTGSDKWLPMLEVWRGNHVAVLPLPEGISTFDEKGIAFIHAPGKDPGGCLSVWAALHHSFRTLNLSRTRQPFESQSA